MAALVYLGHLYLFSVQLVCFKVKWPKKIFKKGLKKKHIYVTIVKHMNKDELILEILEQNYKTSRCH